MRKASWLAIAVLFAAAGCTASKPVPAPIEQLPWRTVVLPADSGGRDLVRAVAACAGHWYIAGAILHPDGSTAPALWTSTDGANFAPMPIKTVSYYGPMDAFSSVACHGGDVVAVGASSGGGHGNPRTSTFLSAAGGTLTEMPAPFEEYGGEDQIGVGMVTAGRPGFLIVGARTDGNGAPGAAVWTSAEGASFTLRDADPALESDPRGVTEVHAAAPVDDGFVAVGGITPPDSPLEARDPLAWSSTDGVTWQREPLPHTVADDLLMNVAQVGGGVVAIGTDGSRFTVWTAGPTGAGWHETAHFGADASDQAPSLVQAGAGAAYAVVATSTSYQLWHGGATATWQQVALPETISTTPVRAGPRVVAAAANGTELMVAADDGAASHLWFAAIG